MLLGGLGRVLDVVALGLILSLTSAVELRRARAGGAVRQRHIAPPYLLTKQGPAAPRLSQLTDNLSHATCWETAQKQRDLEGLNALFRCPGDASRLCVVANLLHNRKRR